MKGGPALWIFFRDVLICSQVNPAIEEKKKGTVAPMAEVPTMSLKVTNHPQV